MIVDKIIFDGMKEIVNKNSIELNFESFKKNVFYKDKELAKKIEEQNFPGYSYGAIISFCSKEGNLDGLIESIPLIYEEFTRSDFLHSSRSTWLEDKPLYEITHESYEGHSIENLRLGSLDYSMRLFDGNKEINKENIEKKNLK